MIPGMRLQKMESRHWRDVHQIYQKGIDTGQATFEHSPPPSWKEWNKKFLPALSLVCLDDGQLVGWAAISRVSERAVYLGLGELSLYIDPEQQERGAGKLLMERVIQESEGAGFWTLQASIFPENQPSLELHRKFGFRLVGERQKIGKMGFGPRAGEWRDTLLLERRSATVGI